MAYDEFWVAERATWFARVTSAFTRWRDAANKAYVGTYTIDDWFEDVREQLVENWDTWNAATGLPLRRQPPTISIEAAHGSLHNESDSAVVSGRLTGIAIEKTKLWRLADPTAFFAPGDYDVQVVGDFDGEVLVTLKTNAPVTPPAGERDVYQGFLTAQFPRAVQPETICSIVVVAVN